MGTVLYCTWPYLFLSTLVTFPLVISVLILGPTLVFFFSWLSAGAYCTVLGPTLVFPTLVRFPLVNTVL